MMSWSHQDHHYYDDCDLELEDEDDIRYFVEQSTFFHISSSQLLTFRILHSN